MAVHKSITVPGTASNQLLSNINIVI